MYNFNIYEIQRVDSELLSKRASRAYSQMPIPEASMIERAIDTVRVLIGKQPRLAPAPVKVERDN